jgi:hypothetical protein
MKENPTWKVEDRFQLKTKLQYEKYSPFSVTYLISVGLYGSRKLGNEHLRRYLAMQYFSRFYYSVCQLALLLQSLSARLGNRYNVIWRLPMNRLSSIIFLYFFSRNLQCAIPAIAEFLRWQLVFLNLL